MPRRLLALDLDGTLLRTDGTVAPRDREAISRAKDQGITVTFATGRLASSTVPLARELGLDTPLVCSDGGTLVDPASGTVLERNALPLTVLEHTIDALHDHGLSPFVMTDEHIHGNESSRDFVRFVSLWTPSVQLHPELRSAHHWKATASFAAALGEKDRIETARDFLAQTHEEHASVFAFRGFREENFWVLVVRHRHCDKATGLETLSKRLGIHQKNVAVVGDWMNDIGMFRWAGRSYAMGQAPEPVRAHATHQLQATSRTGGGIAEAIEHWLSLPPLDENEDYG